MTPYFDDGGGRVIYHGDWAGVADVLGEPFEADALVTDPPYGINLGVEDRHTTRASARTSTGNPSGSTRRVPFPPIHGDGEPFDPAPWLYFPQIVLWGANHYASRLPDSPSWLIWDKRVGMNSNHQADVEMAWTNLGGPARIYRQVWNGGIRPVEDRRAHKAWGVLHPAQKPLGLMRWCIDKTTGTILDPFMGSGTTLVAAKSLNRPAIGIEIEERYCEIAATRLLQETLGLDAA